MNECLLQDSSPVKSLPIRQIFVNPYGPLLVEAVEGKAYWSLKFGCLFSTNAFIPSRRSSSANVAWNALRSTDKPS